MAFVLLNMQAESRCLSRHNYTFQHCPSRLGAASLAPLPPATASTARRLPHATGTGRRAGAGVAWRGVAWSGVERRPCVGLRPFYTRLTKMAGPENRERSGDALREI